MKINNSEDMAGVGVMRFFVVLVYLLIGAAVFTALERTDEPNKVVSSRQLQAARNDISVTFGINITEDEFDDIVNKISAALRVRRRRDWTFWRSFDFVVISLTTIGYGDVAPRTLLGKGVFIIYALIGLPLMLSALKHSGETTLVYIGKFIMYLENKSNSNLQHHHMNIKCFVVSLGLFFVCLVGNSLLFQRLYNISFIEGMYASLVTFSTIGFGDYRWTWEKQADKYSAEVMTTLLVLQLPILLLELTIVSCVVNSIADLIDRARKKVII